MSIPRARDDATADLWLDFPAKPDEIDSPTLVVTTNVFAECKNHQQTNANSNRHSQTVGKYAKLIITNKTKVRILEKSKAMLCRRLNTNSIALILGVDARIAANQVSNRGLPSLEHYLANEWFQLFHRDTKDSNHNNCIKAPG